MNESFDPAGPRRNADYPWAGFDSDSYFEHNYRRVRDDDRSVVALVRDYFAANLEPSGDGGGLRGIDVGTGPNFYPALSMLPFCDRIDLFEYSETNIAWLERQRSTAWGEVEDSVRAFWEIFSAHPVYRDSCDPAGLGTSLASRTSVVQGSVFDLYVDPHEAYDVGTMFFVAESLSADEREFELAVQRFLGVLRPGGCFAAAMMERSQGYEVDGVRYPATAVTVDDIRRTLTGLGAAAETHYIPLPGVPIRATAGWWWLSGRHRTETGPTAERLRPVRRPAPKQRLNALSRYLRRSLGKIAVL